MAERIVINPLTRISGFMEIDVTVQNNIVVEAKTKGFLFRGFEKMLEGRNPLDAVYFTQRICGICSAAHSIASTQALENAFGFVPLEQGRYLRDIIHGCEFLQNHIRHFYQYTLPDFVRLPPTGTFYEADHQDFRLPENVNTRLAEHYFRSLEMGRSAHEMLAVLGGKAPHNHGVFLGGITTRPTTDKIIKLVSILSRVRKFIIDFMVPDVYTIAEYYEDYFYLGTGYGNLLSYGCFNDYETLGTLYVQPSVFTNGVIQSFDAAKITEKQEFTYKQGDSMVEGENPGGKAYTWVKAARYENVPYEVGPLARMFLSGQYKNGISMMDRTIARVLEARKITEVMLTLLRNITPDIDLQKEYAIPESGKGQGMVDTTRGALGHWLEIKNQVLSSYQIITPSVWNLSPQDDHFKGTVEQALLGTPVRDVQNPVELGRIIRSYDPCVSCATHVHIPGREVRTIGVMP